MQPLRMEEQRGEALLPPRLCGNVGDRCFDRQPPPVARFEKHHPDLVVCLEWFAVESHTRRGDFRRVLSNRYFAVTQTRPRLAKQAQA